MHTGNFGERRSRCVRARSTMKWLTCPSRWVVTWRSPTALTDFELHVRNRARMEERMYVLIHFFDDSILFLLLLAWIIAGSVLLRLPKRVSSQRRWVGIRSCFVWLGVAELLVVIKLGTLIA